MARKPPTTAYTEVQIDEDSISLTFITESGNDGAVIEDTERFTFEELQSLSGEHSTLSLSRETRDTLETSSLAVDGVDILENPGRLAEDEVQVEEGDVLIDENSPSWSGEDRVEVVEVLSNVKAEEYVIQGQHEGQALDTELQSWDDESVADANQSYHSDESVIIAEYIDGCAEYAFPKSRLVEE